MDWKTLNEEVIACQKCPRLVAWREQVAQEKRAAFRDQEYWGKPVPGFGDPNARVMVVGLAPGAHGSNRTGRMFTGDASGDFLYPALYRAGFCNRPAAIQRGDGLEMKDVFITAVGRCAPPQNKPAKQELLNCRPFLLQEIDLLTNLQGFVALGGIAFQHLLEILRKKYGVVYPSKPKFAHGACYRFPHAPWLLASYHPSRQNTQTGRLTEEMFDKVWTIAREKIE
ncbi:MAG TPA: uracil-DNA glycosylase [Anaerolineaceae bacterium]|nr:uracil-DNA glycosylase [Anaerolineaceae bacterium]